MALAEAAELIITGLEGYIGAVDEGTEEIAKEFENNVREGLKVNIDYNFDTETYSYEAKSGEGFKFFDNPEELKIQMREDLESGKIPEENQKSYTKDARDSRTKEEVDKAKKKKQATADQMKKNIDKETTKEGKDKVKKKYLNNPNVRLWMKRLFGIGLTIFIIEAMAVAKSGCYITVAGTGFREKVGLTGCTSPFDVYSDKCKKRCACGITKTVVSENQEVIKACDALCTDSKCSKFTKKTAHCGCGEQKYEIKYEKYQFWDIMAELYAEGGYILNEANEAVKALPSFLESLFAWLGKYWWVALIIIGIIVLSIVIYFVRKAF